MIQRWPVYIILRNLLLVLSFRSLLNQLPSLLVSWNKRALAVLAYKTTCSETFQSPSATKFSEIRLFSSPSLNWKAWVRAHQSYHRSFRTDGLDMFQKIQHFVDLGLMEPEPFSFRKWMRVVLGTHNNAHPFISGREAYIRYCATYVGTSVACKSHPM